ncbi:MAG TPA: hypothetical protein VKY39_02270, partial [Aggregatilineales bacterium]|nr:hypothetical protein [Aggregatilineales bacterium]
AQVAPTAQPAPTSIPAVTAVPLALPTPAASIVTAEPTPSGPWLTGEVRVFPGPRHYIGDVLTVEVEVANAELLDDPPGAALAVDGNALEAEPFLAWSPLRENALVFRWAWDTAEAEAGPHQLTVSLPQEGGDAQTLRAQINLEPAESRPAHEEAARWAQRLNDCCRISYLTGTAAERDIAELDRAIDTAFDEVEARLGVLAADKPVQITLLDNVWGNGAFVSQDMVLSYVDRAYTSPDFNTTLRHEATHWTMRAVGTAQTPPLLSEGVAVYIAGGHFKTEPIPERAAALLSTEQFIPLRDLADNFWSYQHEIAYLEAAGLVAYLVETYGLEDFLRAYGMEGIDAASDGEWLDAVFRRVYRAGLAQIEREYRAWLLQRVPGAQTTDLELTVLLFDTIRQYQALYAQYQEALPTAQEAIAAGQVAEFMREPSSKYNVALEAIFISAHEALHEGRYQEAEWLLLAAQATLADGDFTREPIAEYLRIIDRIGELGYEAQRITLVGDGAALVEAIQLWPQLRTLHMVYDGERWQLVEPVEP